MKKQLVLLVCFALMLLAACSSSRPPTAEKIKEDLNASPDILPWIEIQNVEIVRSRTDEANRSMTADITFTGVDEYADYTGSITLFYNQYDNDIWMMDEFENLIYNSKITHHFNSDENLGLIINAINSLYDDDFDLSISSRTDLTTDDIAFVDVDYCMSFPYIDFYCSAKLAYQYEDGNWFFDSDGTTYWFNDADLSRLNDTSFTVRYDTRNEAVSISKTDTECIVFYFFGGDKDYDTEHHWLSSDYPRGIYYDDCIYFYTNQDMDDYIKVYGDFYYGHLILNKIQIKEIKSASPKFFIFQEGGFGDGVGLLMVLK